VWIAENVGTITSTWIYPHQAHAWALVKMAKLGSWFLLLIVSYALVAAVHGVRRLRDGSPEDSPITDGAPVPDSRG
jgi:uncharacterized membrane protein YoaT (DUF817 family)